MGTANGWTEAVARGGLSMDRLINSDWHASSLGLSMEDSVVLEVDGI